MDNTGTSVTSEHCARVSLRPSVRPYLAAGGAMAGAGILALGLVAAPPDVHGARTEVRAVQLAALTLPSTAPSAAILEKFVRNQAQISALVTRVVEGGGAADINTALATAPLAFVRVGQPAGSPTQAVRTTAESTTDPAIDSQLVDNATLATIPDATSLTTILAQVLLAPFVLGFFGLIVVLALIQNFFYNAENATAATLTSDPLLSDSARVTIATEPPADAKPTTEAGKADVSPQVTSIDKRTHTEQVSTGVATSKKDVTETVEAEEESTEPTAVKASESSASDPTSETAKPAGRPETPRPVVRDSLGSGKQLSEQSHPGNGGSTADDEPTTAGSSSVASSSHGSSSKGSRSSDGDSSGSDAGGSE
jgi:hypothetical protein